MYRIDNRGNIRLPRGDTLLACIPLCAEIPEGTEAVLSVCTGGRSDAVLQKHLGIANNRITVILTNEESEALDVGRYLYDVELVTSRDGEKLNVLSVFSPPSRTLEITRR